ncbi:T9SS type A sorting domain-containing protein [Fibrella sp. HMF5405]|uniref:T9SS type A sorting domain-containing protein n=2 Tax=Fibrella forsythiae TaxID=2817061 RepID=A0ABS3JCA6_9BACT|nr:T9SS type A sorting domain-containing protein [Fibrella forsythiae]
MAVDEPATDLTTLEVVVTPNPNSGQFTVLFQTKAGQMATLRISDLKGRAVRPTHTILGTGCIHQETVNLPAQVPGVLLLEVVSGQQRGIRKVLIE